MNLVRTEASIKALKNQKNATIVDALNIFYDLCKDIKDNEGTLIHKLPVGDENAVVNRLVWGSNQLQKIAKHNENTVGYEAQKERLQNLEKDAKELGEKFGTVEELIANYEKKKEELDTKQKLEKARFEKQQQLEKECAKLEEEILYYGENQIPQLQIQKQQAEQQYEALKAQYDVLVKDVENVTLLLEELKVTYQNLVEERDEKINAIQVLQTSIAKLKGSVENLKEKYAQLQFEYTSCQASVAEYETVKVPQMQKQFEEVKAILAQYMTQFYEISSKVSVMQNEVNNIQQRVIQLQEQEQTLCKQKETLQTQETVLAENIKQYKECIETATVHIKTYEDEIVIVKKRCEDASNELQALLQRYKVLDEQRQVSDSETIQWTAKVMALETECNEKETEKNKQKELFEQLEQKKATLEDVIEKLGEQQQVLIQDILLLEETLRKSSVDELKKEKEEKEQQLEDLKQERVNLTLSIQTYSDKLVDRENEKRNLTDTLNKKKEQLSKQEIEIGGLRNEKEEWERKLQTLQKEMEALQLWFRSRYNSDDKKRMDNYKRRIQFLKEAQQEWRTEVYLIHQFANDNVRAIMNQFSDDYESYHQTLMQIDEILNNYQNAYRVVTRALYAEQKGNEII